MDAFAANILPLLPLDLQALYQNPPSLSSPTSFIPAIRLLLPYSKYLVVFLAIWIVWSFITGLFGYFSRFLRFASRVGPIIGLVAWLMANSGHGSMDELFGLVKQWAGIDLGQGQGVGAGAGRAGMSPGIASLASLFGGGNGPKAKGAGRKARAGKTDPVSGRTRAGSRKAAGAGTGSASEAGEGAAEFISSFLNSAASSKDKDAGLGGIVQDYVKDSLAKAAGLDWLFGSGAGAPAADKKDEKKKGWTR
ncbi:hypothetical protein IAU60_001515 [Kwoniella sp. DSM 27419]